MLTCSLQLTKTVSLPPWQTTNAIIELYIKYCNCQPLPLFSPQYLRDTISSRDPELLLALISLAARFSSDSEVASSTAIVEESQRLVATRVSQGPVELSTIQTLCILSLREFNRMSILLSKLKPADSRKTATLPRPTFTVLWQPVSAKALVFLPRLTRPFSAMLARNVEGAIGVSCSFSAFTAILLGRSCL